MKRWIVVIFLIVALTLLAFVLYPKAPNVEVAEVRKGDLTIELFTTGVVESELLDVAPRIAAPISRLLVREGQVVSTGQELAILDRGELIAQMAQAKAGLKAAEQQYAQAQEMVRLTISQTTAAVSRAQAGLRAARARLADLEKGARSQEIERARAGVRQAQAEAERSRAELNRAELLFQQGAISERDFDAARTAAQVASAQLQVAEEQLALVQAGARPEEINVARADVQAAEAALGEAKAGERSVTVRRKEAESAKAQVERARAAVEAGEAQLEFTVIRSPFDAVVARKHLEEGAIASPQNPVYTLARLGPVWVTAEVDESDVAALHVGQRVTITTDAFPGQQATGSVVRTSPIAEPKAVGLARAKIVRARIEIKSSPFTMLPGMEVDIASNAIVARDTVLVPNTAIVRVGETSKAFVVRGNRVYPRNVRTGYSSFDLTEIRSGLRPGELVATTRSAELRAGQRVNIRRSRDGL